MASTNPYQIQYPLYDDLIKSGSSASALADDFRDLAGSTNTALATVHGEVNAYIRQLTIPYETGLSNVTDRVEALEVIGGLAPGDVSDATMANIAANTSSLFFEQMRYHKDTPTYPKTLIEIDHYSSLGSAYGLDIQNFPGANAGLVLHQYSSVGLGAFILDNTGSTPAIRISNTQNQSINPGSHGSGVFFRLSPWNDGNPARFDLRDDLFWDNASPYGHGVINTVGGVGFTVDQKFAGIGLHVKQATALYGLRVDATEAAGYFVATGNQGQAMTVRREGTAGTTFRLDNLGSGWSVYSTDSVGVSWTVAANGQQRLYKAGVGIILRSAGGSSFELTVSDAGQPIFTPVA